MSRPRASTELRHPAQNRRAGIGRALLRAAEADLSSEGARFLQVKTLGPARPHEGYQKTRSFYLSQGFTPLEEIQGLWPENPCLILVKALNVQAKRPSRS